MKCPNCDYYIGWGFIEDECIDPNVTFECPKCEIKLRYYVDEGTYQGASVTEIEVVDGL